MAMLPQWNSQKPLLGVLTEHGCPRCHREVELPLGALCRECRAEIEQRSSRLARRLALGTTLVLAIYVYLRMPHDDTAQLVGMMAIGIWYVISHRVVKRVAREWLNSSRWRREF